MSEPLVLLSTYYILSKYESIKLDVLDTLHSHRFGLLLTVTLIWGAIGFLTGGDLIKVYSDFRCFVVLIFVLCLLKKAQASVIDYISILFVYCVCQTFIDTTYMLFHISDTLRFTSIAVCPFFCVLVLLKNRNIKMAFIFELLLLFENVVAAFKYNYILMILSFFNTLLIN